jgi:hypothetical protein
VKSRCTNFPDSENHFENREWELISRRRVRANLEVLLKSSTVIGKDYTCVKDVWKASGQEHDRETFSRSPEDHGEARLGSMKPYLLPKDENLLNSQNKNAHSQRLRHLGLTWHECSRVISS